MDDIEETFLNNSDDEDEGIESTGIGMGFKNATARSPYSRPATAGRSLPASLPKARSFTGSMATISPENWIAEAERVAPQLVVHLPNDHKDWRMHLNQMKTHQTSIREVYESAGVDLARLNTEIEQALEKITSREKYVNAQFEPLIEEYRLIHTSLAEAKQQYDSASETVTKLSNELAQVSEQLDSVKVRSYA
jgi:estrogen-related receptor beta like 1